MIPYAFGVVTLVSVSFLSDHLNHKAWVTFGCLCTSVVGFVVLLATTNKVALVAGACFVCAGAYPGLAVGVAWAMTFHGGYTKRVMGVFFMQIFIQCESIIATQVYDTPPRFFKGHGVALGFYFLAAASTVVLLAIVAKANAARDRRAREFQARGEVDEKTLQTIEDLCDYHPLYRYAL